MALFQCCCILDGVCGGQPIPGVVSAFALYLERYASAQDRDNEHPLASDRINCPNEEPLHDLLNGVLWPRREGDGDVASQA